jgi:hypothetical protein
MSTKFKVYFSVNAWVEDSLDEYVIAYDLTDEEIDKLVIRGFVVARTYEVVVNQDKRFKARNK